MAKPSNAGKASKSHSPKEGRAKSSGLGARSDKASGHFKKSHEKKMSAGKGNAFGDFEKMDKKMSKGDKSKNGCLPKLFMMFLPFMVIGAYFVLST